MRLQIQLHWITSKSVIKNIFLSESDYNNGYLDQKETFVKFREVKQ